MSNLLRALIVEDSQDDAAMLLRELRRAGYEVVSEQVETARDMDAALDRAEWDVILSDYTMPHFSALDALAVLKNRQTDLPFIIISGTIGEETAVNAMKAGAHDFLIKGRLARLFPALERELREVNIRRERRKAEEALRESEERYRALFERNLAGVLCATWDGRILECNQAMADMLGYSSSPEVRNLRMPDLYYLHEDRARFLDDLEAKGRLTNHELHWRRKDGSPIWLIANVGLTTKTPGGQRIIESTFVDITERKLAETENTRLAAIVNSSDDAIFSVTREGLITTWNAGAQRMYGYAAEEIMGKVISVLVPEDRQSLLAANREKLYRGEALIHYEFEHIRKDGLRLPVSLTLSPIKDATGFVTGVSAISRDITERKRTEAEKARLVTAIEQSAEGVVITNLAGEIEYVNPAFSRITGYSGGEVLGKNLRMLKSNQQASVFYEHLWTTILKGEIWHGELINQRKDGKLYTEEMNIAPVRDERGEITHFIATKQDISGRKLLENQFRQAQKMEAVGRLAGGVAHDFNNLLTVINGYSEMMLEHLDSADPKRGPLEEVRNAGGRAASLTRQLLAFSRLQVLAPRVLDLNAVVADVEKMLRRLIGEDIELAIVRDPALHHVKADPGQVDQIIVNLAVNARDAMPQGGKLVIETANVELDEAYADKHGAVPPGQYVMLAVIDTGIGMGAETQSHIFEPFFTTKEKDKGTGLGLAMVYGIVKQSGGFLWVYSELGQGTTFKIYLPRVEEAGEPVQALKPRVHSVAGSETILLLEDEEAVRALAVSILQERGYNVLKSASPEDAIQIGERHKEPIHLLLTDVVMPGMSGRKVAEHLAFVRPDMKVLYMSGYTDDSIVRHGVLEANTAFLQKPFTPSSLARKVREVLDAHREEQT